MTATASACVHHWRIDTPSGPTVAGVCKLCGLSREFPTSADETRFFRNYIDHRPQLPPVPGVRGKPPGANLLGTG